MREIILGPKIFDDHLLLEVQIFVEGAQASSRGEDRSSSEN